MWKTLLIMISLIEVAHAYRFTRDFQNGFYWENLPIRIAVVESNPTLKNKLDTLTAQAVQEWETSTNLDVWDIVPAGNSTNIIRWSNDFANETKMDEGSVLAVAIRYTEGPYFAKTEIVINGKHRYNQNNSDLFTTIKHELGHTMGLDHSDVLGAIMWPELQTYGVGVSHDDVQGMNEAYDIMMERQLTRYVSPLAYETSSESQGLSCATVTTTPMAAGQGLVSLIIGMLISFVRKVKAKFKWFK